MREVFGVHVCDPRNDKLADVKGRRHTVSHVVRVIAYYSQADRTRTVAREPRGKRHLLL